MASEYIHSHCHKWHKCTPCTGSLTRATKTASA
jgi:hypothetical protein